MNKLAQDRSTLAQDRAAAGRPITRPLAPAKHYASWRTVSWRAPRGQVVALPEPLPDAVAEGLGLMVQGADEQGRPTSYSKPVESSRPDTVRIPHSRRHALVVADGTAMPEGTQESDRYDGLRQLVARECDVDNRRGEGGVEYYAEKYPAFVRMAEREMDAKQRAAALAASHGVKMISEGEKV